MKTKKVKLAPRLPVIYADRTPGGRGLPPGLARAAWPSAASVSGLLFLDSASRLELPCSPAGLGHAAGTTGTYLVHHPFPPHPDPGRSVHPPISQARKLRPREAKARLPASAQLPMLLLPPAPSGAQTAPQEQTLHPHTRGVLLGLSSMPRYPNPQGEGPLIQLSSKGTQSVRLGP